MGEVELKEEGQGANVGGGEVQVLLGTVSGVGSKRRDIFLGQDGQGGAVCEARTR